jgi:Luciferase-like monooxygenase
MAAFAPAALKRVATVADGWNPTVIPAAGMVQMFGAVKQMATEAGRDPASLALVVRANVLVAERPLPKERAIFSGTIEQIKEDAIACREIGAHELFYDPTFSPGAQSLDRWLALMEQLRKLV